MEEDKLKKEKTREKSKNKSEEDMETSEEEGSKISEVTKCASTGPALLPQSLPTASFTSKASQLIICLTVPAMCTL